MDWLLYDRDLRHERRHHSVVETDNFEQVLDIDLATFWLKLGRS